MDRVTVIIAGFLLGTSICVLFQQAKTLCRLERKVAQMERRIKKLNGTEDDE